VYLQQAVWKAYGVATAIIASIVEAATAIRCPAFRYPRVVLILTIIKIP